MQEAREYLAHDKEKQIGQNATWQQAIAKDFAKLRETGLDHPRMVEIEAVLGIVGRRRTLVGEDR